MKTLIRNRTAGHKWRLAALGALLTVPAVAQPAQTPPPAEISPPAPAAAPAPAQTPTPGPDSTPGEATQAVNAGPTPVDTTPAPAPVAVNPPVVDTTVPPPADSHPVEGLGPNDPLAGFTGETAYLRSADNNFVLMPNGRVQIDGYFYKRDTDKLPPPSFLVRRARLELFGWIGPWAFFSIAGDFASGTPAAATPVAQSYLAATDDYVGIAPWKELAMLQIGQFDAPFTLENRTSDKYFDFMERSMTVRAFGIPSNKETGAMVHGMLPDKVAYYSLGLFDGDGQNFRNVDSKFDVMGRAWIAPFALAGVPDLKDITLGGSLWLGSRGDTGLRMGSQTTQGNLSFLDPTFKVTDTSVDPNVTTNYELHQHGKLRAFALEANMPFTHKLGARVEYVHKSQELAVETSAVATGATFASAENDKMQGWGMYGQVWYWLVGDDTIIGTPGLQLPSRLKKFEVKEPKDGLMLTARIDHLHHEIISDDPQIDGNTLRGTYRITSGTFGVNYWHSKRFRATFNYVMNHFGGTAPALDATKAKLDGGSTEHEFLFRLAVAL